MAYKTVFKDLTINWTWAGDDSLLKAFEFVITDNTNKVLHTYMWYNPTPLNPPPVDSFSYVLTNVPLKDGVEHKLNIYAHYQGGRSPAAVQTFTPNALADTIVVKSELDAVEAIANEALMIAQSPPNIPNGYFSYDLDKWVETTTGVTSQLVTTKYLTGTKSVELTVTNPATALYSLAQNEIHAITPGHVFRVKAHLLITVSEGALSETIPDAVTITVQEDLGGPRLNHISNINVVKPGYDDPEDWITVTSDQITSSEQMKHWNLVFTINNALLAATNIVNIYIDSIEYVDETSYESLLTTYLKYLNNAGYLDFAATHINKSLSSVDPDAANKLTSIADGATKTDIQSEEVGSSTVEKLFINDVATNIHNVTPDDIRQGITINSSGVLVGIGTANKVVDNSQITINSSGILLGIGTSNVVVDNSKITIDSDSGQLLGIGGITTVVANEKITINETNGVISGIDPASTTKMATYVNNPNRQTDITVATNISVEVN